MGSPRRCKSLKINGLHKFIFCAKYLDNPLVKFKFNVMKNWIPRSERWTQAEREAKKIANMNEKRLQRMFWCELDSIRQQIEKEISGKRLARIRILE